ncbi:flagellar hook-basal body protein [Symbiobacterium terraclitae]|uniref:flagellar hook-basal body protein n=1 Tax=Symbiobacterium terraclitae TaxID=557451 RepID=UPI0035B50609
MIRGIEASRSGMAVEQLRTDVLADNIANVNTSGFKRSSATSAEFDTMLLYRMGDPADAAPQPVGTLGNGSRVDQVVVDERQGDLRETGRSLDLALTGPGYFLAQRPDGSLYRTRNGAFRQMADGTITTAEGYPVLMEDAAGNRVPLVVPGAEPAFGADGTVLAGGQPVGRLALDGADAATRLRTRYLEASNVDLAKEMTDLIVTLRAYQVNQRAMRVQDETLAKAVSEIGKV